MIRRAAASALLCLGAVLVAGCAGTPALPPAAAAPAVYLEVPFHPQTEHHCGPAALAGVLAWSGIEVAPERLGEEVYLPTRKGALQAELVAAARRRGRLPYVLEPDFGALLAELDAGHPVLVLQNLAFAWMPQWHYAVVIGRDGDELILHSGRTPDYRVARTTFEATWQRAGRWGMVVLPPGELPATAEPVRLLGAVAALEALGHHAAAERGYRAAVERWPEAHTARLGLAAALYGGGRHSEAEQTLRALLAELPDWGPALNNLAHLLAERGAFDEAEQLARRAVAAGGPQVTRAEATLLEIEAAKRSR